MDVFERAAEFNRGVVGIEAPQGPTRLSDERKSFRANHLQEEAIEFDQAETIEDEIDALVDLIYVAAGALYEMGVDGAAHFLEVHRANMRREPGPNPSRGGVGFDAVKPEGWVGPDHRAVLSRHFWLNGLDRPRSADQVLRDLADWLSAEHPVGNAYMFEFEDTDGYLRRQTLEHPRQWREIAEHNASALREQCKAPQPRSLNRCVEILEEEVSDAGKPTVVEAEFWEVKKPKIVVIGHGRHGKDTVAEMLRDRYGLSFTSSSLFCAERVMMPAFDRALHRGYGSAEACYDDRHGSSATVGDHRTFWFEEIAKYCADPVRLGREILADHDVYCGIRSRREFHAVKNARLADLVVWVDASDRHPPEQASSMQLEPWMADAVLDNNGTLEDLGRNLEILMEGRF